MYITEMEMDSKSNITKGSKTEPLVKRMTLGARLHKQLVRKCHLYALFTKLSDTPSTLEKLFQLFHYVHFPMNTGPWLNISTPSKHTAGLSSQTVAIQIPRKRINPVDSFRARHLFYIHIVVSADNSLRTQSTQWKHLVFHIGLCGM